MQATDLISQLLKYNPKSRLSPMQAIAHPFFDELRQNPDMKLPNNYSLPTKLFEFCEEEKQSCPPELVQSLYPTGKRTDGGKHDM